MLMVRLAVLLGNCVVSRHIELSESLLSYEEWSEVFGMSNKWAKRAIYLYLSCPT